MEAAGCSAVELKDEGNRCFGAGRHVEALEAYAAALQALEGDEGKQQEHALRCTLHSNRAACYLQLKRFGECVEVRLLFSYACVDRPNPIQHDLFLQPPTVNEQEATAALALNPQQVKALYRRAQACERLGQLEPALRDLRLALHLDSGNRDVLVAARRVGEALQSQLQARSPVAQMLDTVRSAPPPPPPPGDQEDGAAGEQRRQKRREALLGLVGLASQEPQAAKDVLRDADVLVALFERAGEAEERLLAFRLLAACCAHAEFAELAFGGDDEGGSTTEAGAGGALARVLEEGEGKEEEGEEELVLVKITLFLRLLKALLRGPVAPEAGSTAAALVEQALDCWTRALGHSKVCYVCGCVCPFAAPVCTRIRPSYSIFIPFPLFAAPSPRGGPRRLSLVGQHGKRGSSLLRGGGILGPRPPSRPATTGTAVGVAQRQPQRRGGGGVISGAADQGRARPRQASVACERGGGAAGPRIQRCRGDAGGHAAGAAGRLPRQARPRRQAPERGPGNGAAPAAGFFVLFLLPHGAGPRRRAHQRGGLVGGGPGVPGVALGGRPAGAAGAHGLPRSRRPRRGCLCLHQARARGQGLWTTSRTNALFFNRQGLLSLTPRSPIPLPPRPSPLSRASCRAC